MVAFLTKKNLREFFSEKIRISMQEQSTRVSPEVEFYLVELLSYFALSENFFLINEKGEVEFRPLALRLYDAVFDRPEKRFYHLKSLGDTALYHAGVFYEGLFNKVVDVDYFINMGGHAYSSLSHMTTSNEKPLAEMFAELSESFRDLVEVLRLTCESEVVVSDNDVLRLLDRYLKTKSKKAKALLQEKGICLESLWLQQEKITQ